MGFRAFLRPRCRQHLPDAFASAELARPCQGTCCDILPVKANRVQGALSRGSSSV